MQNKNAESVSGYWAKQTLHYDHQHPQLRLLKKIIETLHEENFKTKSAVKVLDIGSSIGTLGKMLDSKKFQYQGLDFAVDIPGIIKFDINHLPFPFDDSAYDIAVAGGSIEYSRDRNSLFKDIHRIVNPGGFFIARYINRESYLQRFLSITWPAKKGNPYMIPWTSPPKFEKELESYFKIVKKFGIPFPTPLWQPSPMSKIQSIPSLSSWLASAMANTCSQVLWVTTPIK